jgi:hypothetical protein
MIKEAAKLKEKELETWIVIALRSKPQDYELKCLNQRIDLEFLVAHDHGGTIRVLNCEYWMHSDLGQILVLIQQAKTGHITIGPKIISYAENN